MLAEVFERFQHRHEDLTRTFEEHYETAATMLGVGNGISRARKLLIGSYLTMEYSIESVALFNPSITPHFDQSGVPDGAVRFIMSLRATGEGHISSIVFRTGTLASEEQIHLDPPAQFSERARLSPDRFYLKSVFQRKLHEMGVDPTIAGVLLERVPERFTVAELDMVTSEICIQHPDDQAWRLVRERMMWLARSNYRLELPLDADVSEVVIYPQSSVEKQGIEDCRLVRFVDDDGRATYYGTYTAWDGVTVLPMLFETDDFRSIQIHTLNGSCAKNKGMALFPRRIHGHYAMCSRIDGQNLYIMYSDYVHFWESAEWLAGPRYPWELALIGNCGSPIETADGWLLLTHGVGPVRRYCIGAMLLDLEDPARIIGRLRTPLISPTEDEREGYVPNVVYSCGSMAYNGRLYIPYAMSDKITSMASVSLDALLDLLKKSPPE